jgi:hypothetical protein
MGAQKETNVDMTLGARPGLCEDGKTVWDLRLEAGASRDGLSGRVGIGGLLNGLNMAWRGADKECRRRQCPELEKRWPRNAKATLEACQESDSVLSPEIYSTYWR